MMIVLAGVAAIAIGTWLGIPTLAIVAAGLAIGLGWPRRAVRSAAAAGFLAWALLLLAAAFRGDAMEPLAESLGAALGLPGWALVVATLLYPTVLAASTAWLAHLVSPRRLKSIQPGAAAREQQLST